MKMYNILINKKKKTKNLKKKTEIILYVRKNCCLHVLMVNYSRIFFNNNNIIHIIS